MALPSSVGAANDQDRFDLLGIRRYHSNDQFGI
jgi:hypothetical protein